MKRYCAYGLVVESEIDLPLRACEVSDIGYLGSNVQVHVRLMTIRRPGRFTPHWPWVHFDRMHAEMDLPMIGRIQVTGGTRVAADVLDSAVAQHLELILVGNVMNAVLYQQNYIVLHASCVSFGGRTHALVGDRGRGKSTIAAALLAQGGRLVTDDVLALREREGEWWCARGYGRIKADALAAEWLPAAKTVSLNESGRARSWIEVPEVDQDWVRVDFVHMLRDAPVAAPSRLRPTEAFISLLPHVVPVRWGYQPDTQDLQQLADFSRSVSVMDTARGVALGCLPALVDHFGCV